MRQHKSFLFECRPGTTETREVIDWMATLPLFLKTEASRAMHACWDEARIAALEAVAHDGVLSKEQQLQAEGKRDPLYDLVDPTTKGPEVALPIGYSFRDKDGTERTEVRLKWWESGATAWADIAMSVPDSDELPITAVPASVAQSTYPADAKPVFFAHYWLSGDLTLHAPSALCLDYSAGRDGTLEAYRLEDTGAPLSIAQIVSVGGKGTPRWACAS